MDTIRTSSFVTRLFAAPLICIAGCGDEAKPKPAAQLNEGAHVTVVSEEGGFTLVERDDGSRGYVPTSLLVNTRESDENKVYAITGSTEFYDKPPKKLPPPPAPRPPRDISRARDQLPVLFMSESGHEFYRSRMQSEPGFDPESQEILWFAMTCTNPTCPAKDQGKEGRPFLFVWPDPDYVVGPNGPVAELPEGRTRGDTLREQTGFVAAQCPACMKNRDPASESDEQRIQYTSWVRQYTLPEAKGRAKQLNREHKRRIELDKQPRQ